MTSAAQRGVSMEPPKTFELTRPRRQGAWGARHMIGLGASRPKTPAVASRVERIVRPQSVLALFAAKRGQCDLVAPGTGSHVGRRLVASHSETANKLHVELQFHSLPLLKGHL